MTHVQIKTGPNGASVVVDGAEIGPHVLHEGFGITANDDGKMLVSMAVMADILDADLPDSVLSVVKAER